MAEDYSIPFEVGMMIGALMKDGQVTVESERGRHTVKLYEITNAKKGILIEDVQALVCGRLV